MCARTSSAGKSSATEAIARPVGLLFLAAVFAVGCANLPEVASGTCGNGVVEPPEDCDTFAPTATSMCLPRGSIGACHLACRRGADGSPASCPTGWGCDAQSICRRPTGDFEAASPIRVGGAWSLMAGDFDGDGRDDLASFEVPDLRGATRVRFHYFDAAAALVETRTFPKRVGSPVIAELSADGRSDLVFSSEQYGVGVLLGQSDRSWVPETAGSYRFANSGVRILSVADFDVESSTPVLGLATIAGVSGLYGPDANGVLRLRGNLPGPVENLAGDPVAGNIVEDSQASPCRELVFAIRGAASFSLVDVCTRDEATNRVLWRDEVTEWSLALDPPSPIDAAPQLTDMNGDGHLDVLLGAAGKPYVAYGDGRGLSVATPYRLPTDEVPAPDSSEIPMPLAAGDFTGDGAVDFVFGDHLLVSTPAAGSTGVKYFPTHTNLGAPWTVARIADMNDNGKPDVIAASSERLGVDFFNGTGTENLLPFGIPTSAPVSQLAVTDLDGDLVNDLIFVEAATSNGERDSLMTAFGNVSGPPLAPSLVARIGHIDQLSASSRSGVGLLIVAYTEETHGTGDHSNGVLAFLSGSGDRLPFAAYALVDVSEGSVFEEAALALVAGRFASTRRGDVMALGVSGEPPNEHYDFWLLPGLATSPSPAVRLGGQIESRLRAVSTRDLLINVNVTAVAADVDGDGRDEAVWAISADEGAHCGLVIAGATNQGAQTMVVRDEIVLDHPCPRPQLVAADADGDGAVDLVLLTGGPADPGRDLLVLWNDGAGGFSATRLAQVNAPGDSPEQFTVLPATPIRPFGIAYVGDRAAALVTAVAASSPRVFGPPRTLVDLQHGSGIVAADVNGDGVLDLALAASGNLQILAAGLATP